MRSKLLAGALFVTLAACGSGGDPAETGPTFIAFAPDFAGFHEWPSSVAGRPDAGPGEPLPPDAGPPADGGVHDESVPKTVYIKLPEGQVVGTEFPVGTLIVKEVDGGELTTRKIFAMVKRGGGYNKAGAKNWEWFELENVDAQSVRIRWRGIGPPAGELYGGDKGGCSPCHSEAIGNDYVMSATLDLSHFH
jgi:hypothetical protein